MEVEVASKAMERCMYSQLQQSLQISPLVGQGGCTPGSPSCYSSIIMYQSS